MIQYLEFLKSNANVPTVVAVSIVIIIVMSQVIGELLEFKGKVAPEILKLRKYFARKKQERETFAEAVTTLTEVKKTLAEVNAHYNADNIKKRDAWMHSVDCKQEQDHEWIKRLDEKLDSISADTLELKIESKRETIISFATYVAEDKNPVTREQFNRIFKIHKEYEDIIKSHGLTNGEVDIAYRIIQESYEKHMRDHSFIEDIRGYNSAL